MSTHIPPQGAVLLALTFSLGAAGCDRQAEGAVPPSATGIPVRVASVEPASATAVRGTGTLGAKDEIALSFKIGGVVARIAVDEGTTVRAGQVLAELDLREIDAAVAKATLGAEKAGRDAARAERLYNDSVATLTQLQDARTARDAAEADLRAARVNREYAVITAPSDGIVLRRLTNAGAQAGPGSTVLVLASARRGQVVRVGLADRDVVRLRIGDRATVAFDAVPGQEFPGVVRQVAAAADRMTGTFTVEVALSGAVELPSGLVGRVQIAAAPVAGDRFDDGLLVIPAQSLVEGDGTRGVVFTLDATGTRAVRREISLVGMSGDRVLVSGLDAAARVVTSGAAWLRDSARVEVRP